MNRVGMVRRVGNRKERVNGEASVAVESSSSVCVCVASPRGQLRVRAMQDPVVSTYHLLRYLGNNSIRRKKSAVKEIVGLVRIAAWPRSPHESRDRGSFRR